MLAKQKAFTRARDKLAAVRPRMPCLAVRTYFNSRGDEAIGSTWSYLDATPLGRRTWEDSPDGLSADPAVHVVELARQYSADASPDRRWGETVHFARSGKA